ncbi:glycerophosphodiester phosphodiesterase family protein [Pontivivens insulae]|uniref:Glycerophosphodiester phosphodiesterase, cytoplasmic n=1 Tax=Pontivivens insulae TaxID=1639689 RepID=A0A2R8AEM2_9RHOB|nr:glycerophosphodiester phosphodiesterase family protein [Pontivivens insulae]RED11947.1 glycerophosphoryl diester phosphodiesterase [Pontivivens insulae]SPF30703.1 Glycerophosphodiester phosphodiesterase, cytoplasmic [Pontivivens insulae]
MLPRAFLDTPIAHRGLHDRAQGRIENSMAAVKAAISGGWGIEIDIQPAGDGTPMVFHDYDLERLTGTRGFISTTTPQALAQLRLTDCDEGIPTLEAVLAEVGGRVPLLIEIKDQDGTLGPAVGALEQRVCALVNTYTGPVALMSFNPNSVRQCRGHAPDIPRGLVTDPFTKEDWPMVPAPRRAKLAQMPDLDPVGATFISHNRSDLDSAAVARAKARGLSILTWTIRSAEQEAEARQIVDNVTFEGYAPLQSA